MKQILYKKTKGLFRFVVYILLPLAGGGWVGVSCSDTWDDHYEGTIEGAREGSLWQAIKQNADLSNFASVIEATGYDRSLGSSQVFTVFAPTNATFTREEADKLISEYQEQKKTVNDDDNTVIKEFVQNHIALYNHSVSSLTNDSIRLMNGKYALLKTAGIDNSNFSQSNTLYQNGVLFTVDKPIDYSANIFEYIRRDADLDSVRSFLYNPMFYYKKFDAGSSVTGGLDELGRTIYLDSVFYQRNDLYSTVGDIASEDSTYWMVLPTNSEWQRLVEEYSNYFIYNKKVGNRLTKGSLDSLMYTNTRLAILEGTAFSRTSNKSVIDNSKTASTLNDSLMSYGHVMNNSQRKNLWGAPFNYYQYYDPMSEGGVFYGAEAKDCSNGRVLKSSNWNISSLQTFNRWIVIEAEDGTNIKSYTKFFDGKDSLNSTELRTRSVLNHDYRDKVWNNSFAEFSPTVTTQAPILTFGIRGVLSNMGYDVYIVTAPALAYDSTATASECLPTSIRVTMGWEDLNGNNQSKQTGTFNTTGTKIDYLLVAEDFKFPVCTRGISEDVPSTSINLECRVSNNQVSTGQRTRTMRIDCILLVPHGTLQLVDDMGVLNAEYAGMPGVRMFPHGNNPYWYYRFR